MTDCENESDLTADDAQIPDGSTYDAEAETVTNAWEGVFISVCWGYNQTNTEFARIIEVSDSGKTVLCRMASTEKVATEKGSERVRPSTNLYGDEFRLHVRKGHKDTPVFRGSYPHIKGNMDRNTRLDTFTPFTYDSENTLHQTPANLGH